jgi:hypothetical protein
LRVRESRRADAVAGDDLEAGGGFDHFAGEGFGPQDDSVDVLADVEVVGFVGAVADVHDGLLADVCQDVFVDDVGDVDFGHGAGPNGKDGKKDRSWRAR